MNASDDARDHVGSVGECTCRHCTDSTIISYLLWFFCICGIIIGILYVMGWGF
ncbi:MAG: hypothetical protein QXR60_04100 [Candidatus Nanoarchaeia archaeon]